MVTVHVTTQCIVFAKLSIKSWRGLKKKKFPLVVNKMDASRKVAPVLALSRYEELQTKYALHLQYLQEEDRTCRRYVYISARLTVKKIKFEASCNRAFSNQQANVAKCNV